jgi:hypothetical protein
MDIGIEITLKDGSKEWLDPVDEAEFDSMFEEAVDKYVVSVISYDHSYKVEDVVNIEKYLLHECCGIDARGRHSYWCVKEEEF